jgi:hypothetical protein
MSPLESAATEPMWLRNPFCVPLGAFAPFLDHVFGDAIHIGGDAVGEVTAKTGFVLDLRERLGTVDHLMALGEGIGAVAIEQIFERGQALECDDLLGGLIGQRPSLVSASKRVLHLLEPKAFRIRPVKAFLASLSAMSEGCLQRVSTFPLSALVASPKAA